MADVFPELSNSVSPPAEPGVFLEEIRTQWIVRISGVRKLVLVPFVAITRWLLESQVKQVNCILAVPVLNQVRDQDVTLKDVVAINHNPCVAGSLAFC
jgi:hypothetical protein